MAEAEDRVERWRPVAGYEGRYEVSDQGAVRALFPGANGKHKPGRVLRPVSNRTHYRVTLVSGEGKRKFHYVHALVLTAFVGPMPPGLEARHHDGNSANNRLGNLSWATHAENMADTIAHGTSSRRRASNAKLTLRKARAIRRRVAAGESQRSVGKRFGIDQHTVWSIVHNELWKED